MSTNNMIKESELTELLFFDLETSGDYPDLDSLRADDPRKADLWTTKYEKARAKDPDNWTSAPNSYNTHSPLSPEFGRIVCGSFCHIVSDISSGKTVYRGRIKSFYDTEATNSSEKRQVLEPIATLLNNLAKSGKRFKLCGHNIKKFDIPYLAKRMIMHGITPPEMLRTWGKKPWEIDHVDTGELWSMGDWSNYSSLDLLSCVLDVPSSKTDLKGQYVGKSFWEDAEYERIKDYCEEDTKCVARICHKWSETIIPLVF